MKRSIATIISITFGCLLATGLFHSLVRAQNLSIIPGSFVDVGFGARPVGMGYAFVGLANDVNAVYWNPAGIAGLQGVNASVMHMNQFGLVDYQFLAFSTPMNSENHALGISAISSGDDLMRETTVQASYGFKMGRLRAGISGKWRNATFGKNEFNEDDYGVFEPDEIAWGQSSRVNGYATGYGVDVGLLVEIREGLHIGAVARDIFAPLGWRSRNNNPDNKPRGVYNENLPFEVVGGISYRPMDVFTITTDFRPARTGELDHALRAGAEVKIFSVLALRAGTEQLLNNYRDERYTVGAGIQLPPTMRVRIFVDYAYAIEPLANTHRFSLAFRF